MEPGERDAVFGLLTTVFGRGPRPSEAVQREIDLVIEPDRMFVVHDGPAVVGVGGSYSFDVALPGGATLPLQAISGVGVAPTHRRRGILREVMRAVVDQGVERGEPVAGLTASEATIYRRFGFGVATRFQTLSVDRGRLLLAEARGGDAARRPAADEPVRLHLASADEAGRVMPSLWARCWPRSPGELSRSPAYWAAIDLDPEEDRDGASARFVVVHTDDAGEPDGAASYRLQWTQNSGGENLLAVEDVVAASDAVALALVDYLLHVDLVTRVEWHAAPVDHPAAVARRRSTGGDGDAREGPPVAPPARRRPLPGGAHLRGGGVPGRRGGGRRPARGGRPLPARGRRRTRRGRWRRGRRRVRPHDGRARPDAGGGRPRRAPAGRGGLVHAATRRPDRRAHPGRGAAAPTPCSAPSARPTAAPTSDGGDLPATGVPEAMGSIDGSPRRSVPHAEPVPRPRPDGTYGLATHPGPDAAASGAARTSDSSARK